MAVPGLWSVHSHGPLCRKGSPFTSRAVINVIMFQYVALAKDKSWQPGPYEGVELMVLHKHEDTGGEGVEGSGVPYLAQVCRPPKLCDYIE